MNKILYTSTKKKYAIGLIHKVYLAKLKSSRKYTASTKTKSEVRGGGRKPWKQKGTGQARAGSTRSPLWVGGGVIFGPKPRTVNKKINRKEMRCAFLATLDLKRQQLLVLENTEFNNDLGFNLQKTHDFASFLLLNKINSEAHVLLILPYFRKLDASWFRNGMRNLKNVERMQANCLNLPQLLKADKIILTRESINVINATYNFNFSV